MNSYLLDTNILINYLTDELPQKELPKIEEIFKTSFNIQ